MNDLLASLDVLVYPSRFGDRALVASRAANVVLRGPCVLVELHREIIDEIADLLTSHE